MDGFAPGLTTAILAILGILAILAAGGLARAAFGGGRRRMDRDFDFDSRKRRENR